jgi:hypothetical protein
VQKLPGREAGNHEEKKKEIYAFGVTQRTSVASIHAANQQNSEMLKKRNQLEMRSILLCIIWLQLIS